MIHQNIFAIADQALVIQFSGFSSAKSSSDIPILTPADAKLLDAKIDNSDPNSGKVRAIGNSDCISFVSYNVENKNLSCNLLFIIRDHASNKEKKLISQAFFGQL